MSRLKQLAIAGLILPFVAACATGPSVDMARSTTPTGSAHDKALYQEYLALAQDQADAGDVEDANYFAGKAIAAAKGETVLPQSVEERPIPSIKGSRFEAGTMRDTLLMALEDGAAERVPNHVARAQAMYDCWLEAFAEQADKNDIARCRKGYDEAMAKVEDPLGQ